MMADVDAQLEANGLPTSFESTSNAPEVSHAAANVAATTSNAEVSQLKQQAPNIEVTTVSKPVQPVDAPAPAPAPHASEPVTTENDVSMEDAASLPAETEVKVNGHSPPLKAETQPVADTSFVDSVLPDSAPSTMLSTEATTDISPVTAPSSSTLPDQAPVSDLRTAPHADALSPEDIAKVEETKHTMDNNADMQDSTPVPQPEVQTSIREKESSLPTPQSPLPASQPETTTLVEPQDGVVVSSVESVDVSATNEQHTEPAPTPAPVAIVSQDQEMTDAPSDVPAPVPKIVREREEDSADEPASKRMRTEEPVAKEPSIKESEISAPTVQESTPVVPAEPHPDDVITGPRIIHMKKVISNLKKSTASQAFRTPVDPEALKIPTYFDYVKKPMDLGLIDNRLKRNDYQSVQSFKDDFYQIITNCVLFNGPDHSITQAARKMEMSFNNQMVHLPPVTNAEPPKVDKKPVKPKIEPIRQPVSRRQSETVKAASPKAPSPTTFAPNPNGMPLIRRDSTLDGRPKRAIVPPKRNSDFGGARPKKKKYELELRFSDEVLKTISSPKHWQSNQYFTHPVDPVALNIPTYFQIIKKPMDLNTVRQKLDGSMYEKARDFEEDVRLIFKNCFKFNPEGDYVYSRGQELEKLFNAEWAKKQDWIAAREPDSAPASVGGDDDDDDSDDDDAGAESDEDDQNNQLQQLQAQLDAIKNQMGQLSQKKKKPSPGVSTKKSSKKKGKSEVPTTKFPGLQKDVKSKKPSKKAKPERERYVTFAEKQYISNGIAMLPEQPMAEALRIIQNSVPALAGGDQGEIELDIEEVPNHALLKLLSFVKKYAGPPPDEPREEYTAPSVSKGKSKKSKSMSRQDQEAQIAELKGTLHHYNEAGSPDAFQSIETGAEDSDDDSNEESEEE